MKQILTTIVLLSLIATTAQAVPVAMQRTGTFVAGPETPSEWNIMVFFDDDDIVDGHLETDDVTNFMVNTPVGTIFQAGTFTPQNSTVIADEWDIVFDTNGDPLFDNTILVLEKSLSAGPNLLEIFSYEPTSGLVGQVGAFSNGFTKRDSITTSPNDDNLDDAGWWEFKTLNGPAVPEPVTATLLLAGTLAMTRRRRVA